MCWVHGTRGRPMAGAACHCSLNLMLVWCDVVCCHASTVYVVSTLILL